MGVGVLGHRHETGGSPVQPVHRMKSCSKAVFFIILHEEIGQGVPVVALAGVDGNPPGLVHHQQILVLIENVQRAGDGLDLLAADSVPYSCGQNLPRPDPGGGEHRLSVQQNAVGQALGPADRSGGEAQLPTEKGIHVLPLLLKGNGQGQSAHGDLL